jgi:hypothetical protein
MPSLLTLLTPASSPHNEPNPTIRVSGVEIGDTIGLFTNNTCTTQIDSEISGGVAVDVTPGPLSVGSYVLYANSTDPAGNTSACSLMSLSYEVISGPVLASVDITNASPTNTTTYNLSYGAVTGSYTHYCILENNTTVGSCSWTAGALPASFVVSGTENAKVLSVWIRDAALSVSTRVDSDSVTLDTTPPIVAISTAASDPTSLTTIPVTITFSETVTGFDISDLVISNGSVANFAGSGSVYTADILIDQFGEITLDIAGAAAVDAAANNSTVATQFTIMYGPAIVPYYAIAPNWNDYARTASPGVACDGTESSYKDCIHGGERKKAVLTGITSCAGLVASDLLDAFKWKCELDGGVAVIYSTALKEKKGLSDLLDATSFKNNQLIISGAADIVSPVGAWWTNTVEALADNSGAGDPVVQLNSASKIYTLSSSRATSGLEINAHKIALVTLGGAILSYGGNFNNCQNYGRPGSTRSCLIFGGGVGVGSHFTWIEGNFNASGARDGITYSDGSFGQLNKLKLVSSTSQYLMSMRENCQGLRFRNVRAHNGEFSSATYGSSEVTALRNYCAGSRFHDLHFNGGYWSFMLGNSGHVVSRVKITNSSSRAIMPYFSDTSFQQLLIVGHGGGGLMYRNFDDRFSFSTVINSAYNLRGFGTGGRVTNHNILSYAGQVIDIEEPNQVLSHFASFYKTARNFDVDDSADGARFSGLMFTDNLANTEKCGLTGTVYVNPPFVDTTCTTTGVTGSSDFGVGSNSDATFIKTATDPLDIFVGAVTVDSVNTSHVGGEASYPGDPSTFDWFNFENFYRVYTLPDLDPSVDEWWETGIGQIWDFRISDTDTIIKDKSGDGQTANDAFINNLTCPSAVHGDVVTTNMRTVPETYLLNAMEILDDDIGNDNGLCESNESCIYAPNIGAYQGEGEYENNSCTFQDGIVSGVTMHAFDSIANP